MSKSKNVTEIQYATFTERLKAAIMDYIGPWTLFFVGAFLQTGLAGIGIAGVILGSIMDLLGIIALLFINGYAPALNRGFTPNKMTRGVRLMKIVNKETMELREINEGDMAILLIRAFIGWFEMFLFFPIIPGVLVAIIMSVNKNNQRLADMIAGTVIIKVEPVEKVNIKDFRMKKSDDPPTFNGMVAEKTEKGMAAKEEGVPSKIAETKVEKIDEDTIFTNPTMVATGKWIFISTSIYLILAQIVHFVYITLITINTSFFIFGGDEPIGNTARGLDNVLSIIGYVMLFISVAGFIFYYLGIRNSDTKKPLLISGTLYLFFIIFRIVSLESLWLKGEMIAWLDFGLSPWVISIGIPYGGLVFDILSIVCLVVALFFLRNFVKNFNEEHQTNISSFFGQISVIVFFTLLFIVDIIGMAQEPFETTPIFNAVIFYLFRLFKIVMIFVYLGVYANLIKLRKVSNVG